ncbi:tetratricopeptide repeat protein [Parvibium lacunae]|uniref:Tetratricopeptide repeat protein n=1 Tax=Parvibium lacunae TaxID=1888893 RepID=A0A368L0H1_9BURK|nr:tetratricopeptide repeat protein [Parvibium lacunae]RCS56569.1 hypothetical protein DU000_11425 [Parvibium lacunae]
MSLLLQALKKAEHKAAQPPVAQVPSAPAVTAPAAGSLDFPALTPDTLTPALSPEAEAGSSLAVSTVPDIDSRAALATEPASAPALTDLDWPLDPLTPAATQVATASTAEEPLAPKSAAAPIAGAEKDASSVAAPLTATPVAATPQPPRPSLTPPSQSPRASTPAVDPMADRRQAAQRFARVDPNRQADSRRRGGWYAALLVLTGAVAAGLWWQFGQLTQPPAPGGAGVAMLGTPSAAMVEPVAPSSTLNSVTPAATSPMAQETPPPAVVAKTSRIGAVKSSVAAPNVTAERTVVKPQAESAPVAPVPASPLVAPASAAPPAAASRLQIQRALPADNPLERGYQALQAGQWALAESAYQQALQVDGRNVDALNGLAAVAIQQKQPELAAQYVQRVLQLDPRNPYAQSLTSLLRPAGANDESQLKLLASTSGADGAAANFTLGLQLGRQGRWHDAQEAFFKAHTQDGTHPDYCFNLAVSLDQIRQRQLARQYYSKALMLAKTRPAQFDTAVATQRLQSLGGPLDNAPTVEKSGQ